MRSRTNSLVAGQRRIGLGNDVLVLGIRGEEVDLVRHERDDGHLGAEPRKPLGELGIDDLAGLGDLFLGLGIDDRLAQGAADQALVVARQVLVDLAIGVSMKPYSLTRAKDARRPIRPMFGPSGVSIGQMRP